MGFLIYIALNLFILYWMYIIPGVVLIIGTIGGWVESDNVRGFKNKALIYAKIYGITPPKCSL